MIGIFLAFFSIIGWLIWTKSYIQVQENFAFVRCGWGAEKVFFKGSFWAYPIVHKVEKVNISEHRLYIDLTGKSSVICHDNIRINLQLTFFMQVKPNSWDVLNVVRTIGATRATEKETLEQLFSAKFGEAIKTVIKSLDYNTLNNQQKEFKLSLTHLIGEDLNGYQINRISIVDLQLLPIEEYDSNNILDAAGIIQLKKMLNSDNKKNEQ